MSFVHTRLFLSLGGIFFSDCASPPSPRLTGEGIHEDVVRFNRYL